MSGIHWQFPRNDSNETEGPNDAGITHFTSNRSANVIRECIQNSLDARADEEQPVVVQIEVKELDPASLSAGELIASIDAAIDSKHNDPPHAQQFKRGKRLLSNSKAVPSLYYGQ